MDERDWSQLDGTVENIVFRNAGNYFTVLELNTADELVTVVGELPEVCAGEELRLRGSWQTHPSFGQQFKAETCERYLPTNASAILHYLSSGGVKGIGPVTAGHLVEKFGDATLEILENEPEKLCEVRGITLKKALKMAEEFQKQFGIRELLIYLGQYAITPGQVLKIWKKWGATAIDRVRENPYLLCGEGTGISFERADQVAAAMERPYDDIYRIKAGILYVLRHNLYNGHTCLPRGRVEETAAALLGVPPEMLGSAATEMVEENQLCEQEYAGRVFLYLSHILNSEGYIAERMKMMLAYPPEHFPDTEREIIQIEKESGITYEALQRTAITAALSQGLLILTGGPGTGKTTTLNAIIRLLETKGQKVLLAAPTGRAAKRMAELTGSESQTIHRLLKVEWTQDDVPSFAKNERNPLECDALVVDELSMVDTVLFESLLRALPMGCRLIMVGDCDQLPSVGAGNILGDLIESRLVPVVQLREVFRQSMNSLIVLNAHRIVQGEMPDLATRTSDFFFIKDSDPLSISDTLISLCKTRLPKTYGFSPIFDIQMLSPSRKGDLGTVEMNKKLQEALNPPEKGKREMAIGLRHFREGDKVMQIRNNYDIQWIKEDGTEGEGVFNGDVGVLIDADQKSSAVTVKFDDRTAVYDREMAEDLELAYAVTVHKSQGNEFDCVVMPMYPGPPQLYYRNLLYTAVTRAKSLLVMVGESAVIGQMIQNTQKTKRYTGLLHLLRQV